MNEITVNNNCEREASGSEVNDSEPCTSNTLQNNTKQEEETGFSLYKSYSEQIPTDRNALQYLLVGKAS